MKSRTGWIVAIILGALIVFLLPFLFMFGYGGGMMGPGYMGGYGYMGPLGFIGMALMWMIPGAIVFLVILGGVALYNNWNNTNRPMVGTSSPAKNCPSCGKAAQADWKTCPFCGNSLIS
jgi:hypothetical protein